MSPKKKSTAASKSTVKKSLKNTEKDDKKLTETFQIVKNVISHKTNTKNSTKVDIPTCQEMLKQFDLNINYGPIIGISRTDRLKRAEYFEIDVKDEVKKILLDTELLKTYPELDLNIWHNIDHDTNLAINKY